MRWVRFWLRRHLRCFSRGSLAPVGHVLLPAIGWRGLFMLGATPALLVFYVQARVAESPVWLAAAQKREARAAGSRVRRGESTWRITHAFSAHVSVSGAADDGVHELLARHAGCVSDVSDRADASLTPETVGLIGVLYGFGSIAGGICFWRAVRERGGASGRSLTAALLAIPVIPL